MLFSSHPVSISFPSSKDIFTLLGNFSLFLIKSSLKYISLNLLSTSKKSWSSLSFKVFLILVNIFWIFNFISSLFFSIFSKIVFNSIIDCSKVLDNSSKYNIFSFNLFFFSSFISSILYIWQSLWLPFPLLFILLIQAAQQSMLWSLQ